MRKEAEEREKKAAATTEERVADALAQARREWEQSRIAQEQAVPPACAPVARTTHAILLAAFHA